MILGTGRLRISPRPRRGGEARPCAWCGRRGSRASARVWTVWSAGQPPRRGAWPGATRARGRGSRVLMSRCRRHRPRRTPASESGLGCRAFPRALLTLEGRSHSAACFHTLIAYNRETATDVPKPPWAARRALQDPLNASCPAVHVEAVLGCTVVVRMIASSPKRASKGFPVLGVTCEHLKACFTIRICGMWRDLSAHAADPYQCSTNASLRMGVTCWRHEPRSHHIAGLLAAECEG